MCTGLCIYEIKPNGGELLEKYWNNYYFSSFHQKWPASVAHVCWGQRDSKNLFSIPLWLPREQSSSSTPKGQGKGLSKDEAGLSYWKVGSMVQSLSGGRDNSREGWEMEEPEGFTRPCTLCSTHPSSRQEILPISFWHQKRFLWVISHWPESSCLKLHQNERQIVFMTKTLTVKPRFPPWLTTNSSLSRLQLSPKNWCQPWCLQGLWQWQIWHGTSTSVLAHQEVQGFAVGLGKKVTYCRKTLHPTQSSWLSEEEEKEQNSAELSV